jgi:hypothetical protein
LRRERVQGPLQSVQVGLAVAMEIGDLTQRMNAGIRSSRAGHTRRFAQKGEKRALDNGLDGFSFGLDLPAAVPGAVVLNREFDIQRK